MATIYDEVYRRALDDPEGFWAARAEDIHWEMENHEVQIDFEQDRVRDIQARIRRTRQTPSASV